MYKVLLCPKCRREYRKFATNVASVKCPFCGHTHNI